MQPNRSLEIPCQAHLPVSAAEIRRDNLPNSGKHWRWDGSGIALFLPPLLARMCFSPKFEILAPNFRPVSLVPYLGRARSMVPCLVHVLQWVFTDARFRVHSQEPWFGLSMIASSGCLSVVLYDFSCSGVWSSSPVCTEDPES